MNRIHILNANFDPVTREKCVSILIDAIHKGKRVRLCTVNVAILMMMRSNSKLQHFVDKAEWIVADGQPLLWVAPMFHGHLPERVTGIDLVNLLAREAEKKGLRIYLLGSEQQIVEKAAEQLKQHYPNITICGIANGFFSESEMVSRADAIRSSQAHILFVAMGVPRQEQFIEEQWERLGVNVAIGVGGSFEVLAGYRKRAPLFLQHIGMEWFYRLIQEPRRMWKRYLTTNVQFLILIGKEAILFAFNAIRPVRKHDYNS